MIKQGQKIRFVFQILALCIFMFQIQNSINEYIEGNIISIINLIAIFVLIFVRI